MTALSDSQVIFAACKSGGSAQQRTAALVRAGARVRSCTLGEELWSNLSAGGADLVIAWLDGPEPEALVTLDRLRADARERGISTLLASEDAALARERCALWVAPELDDATFVRSVADLLGAQQQLRAQQELTRNLRAELRQADTHLRRLSQDMGELGHEARSMLNAILGIACNLRDDMHGSLNDEQREQVRAIVTAVERARLLLDSTRAAPERSSERSPAMSSVPPRAQRSLVQLAQLAEEVCSLMTGVAERKGLALESALDDSVYVWGEPLKLKQLITNLVVNAIKYTAHGQVMLRVAWNTPSAHAGLPARRAALIAVSDTGPGIPIELRAQIWKRGFRAHQHAHAVEGEGIGLSVVHEIVQQHGGQVSVEDADGGGALFTVTLPQDRRQRARPGAEKGSVS